MPPIICLLIDDDPDDCWIFDEAVKNTGLPVECHFAYDGINALEKLSGGDDPRPHIIFLDGNMPRMSGWEFLAAVRQKKQLTDIPVIMYCTTTNPYMIEEAKQLGAREYITKMSNPDELTATLKEIFQRY